MCDQHIYMLWLFVLGNGVGYANHITRSQEQGHMATRESLILV